jgi:hypothetical protein
MSLLVSSTVHAGLISSVTSSNNAVAQVTGVSLASYADGVGFPPGFNIGSGAVTIDLNVFELHTPVQLTFNYDARGTGQFGAAYAVTLRVTNSVTAVGPDVDFNGFDLTNNGSVSGGVSSSGLAGLSPITSDVFATEYSGGLNITNGFRWGGLLGGGGRLAPGGTAVNTFVYNLTWGGATAAGSSTLNFTANPEPTTLLLGSLVMAPAAWVIRRRRKAVTADTEAAPV